MQQYHSEKFFIKFCLLLLLMPKWLQKFMLFFAALTVTGHAILPHHHADQQILSTDNHHEDYYGAHLENDHHDAGADGSSLPDDQNHSSELGKVLVKFSSADEFLPKASSSFVILQIYTWNLGWKSHRLFAPLAGIKSCHLAFIAIACHYGC